MPFPESALWDIVELEAVEKYYIWSDKEKRFAEKPAITINTGFTLAPDAKAIENYTVYFGEGLGHWNFKSIKKAHVKIGEILTGRRAQVATKKGVLRTVQYRFAVNSV
jgi:hypothetical protein